MRRLPLLFLSLLALVAAPNSLPAAEDLRFAVVDLARLMEEAPQGEAVARSLRAEFSTREREILAKRQELESLYEQREKDGEIMSEQELYELNREISQKNRILSRRENEYLEDYNLRRNEELAGLQRVILQEVQDYASEAGYDVVLGDAVMYSSERAEITDQILSRLEADASPGEGGS